MDIRISDRTFDVNSFLVNFQGRLGLYALLNLLQETAWTHATQIGHGFESRKAQRTFWVLTRQRLIMDQWPGWGRTIEIRTWLRPPQDLYAIRDFEILLDGRKIGESATSWLLLDAETRRPFRGGLAEIAGFKDIARAGGALSLELPKLEPILGDGNGSERWPESSAEFQVRNSDLDLNRHVNNTKYAQWILDSIPMDWHERFRLREYQVNFLAECKSGDVITIQKAPSTPVQDGSHWARFQGWRASDRKMVFTAALRVVEGQGHS